MKKRMVEKLVGAILLISILFSIEVFVLYLSYRSKSGPTGNASADGTRPMVTYITHGRLGGLTKTIYLSKGKLFYPFFRAIGFLDSKLTGVEIIVFPGVDPYETELMLYF